MGESDGEWEVMPMEGSRGMRRSGWGGEVSFSPDVAYDIHESVAVATHFEVSVSLLTWWIGSIMHTVP